VGVYEWQEVEDFVARYFAGEDAQTLSPLIDTADDRFNHQLELGEEEKIDFKIKARQFVKVYGQMASILPFEVVEWEKLFWFLKFLVPKLRIKDPDQDTLDELLESVDLSSYGLERTSSTTASAWMLRPPSSIHRTPTRAATGRASRRRIPLTRSSAPSTNAGSRAGARRRKSSG